MHVCVNIFQCQYQTISPEMFYLNEWVFERQFSCYPLKPWDWLALTILLVDLVRDRNTTTMSMPACFHTRADLPTYFPKLSFMDWDQCHFEYMASCHICYLTRNGPLHLLKVPTFQNAVRVWNLVQEIIRLMHQQLKNVMPPRKTYEVENACWLATGQNQAGFCFLSELDAVYIYSVAA